MAHQVGDLLAGGDVVESDYLGVAGCREEFGGGGEGDGSNGLDKACEVERVSWVETGRESRARRLRRLVKWGRRLKRKTVSTDLAMNAAASRCCY